MKWQPIETAPKSAGYKIDLFGEHSQGYRMRVPDCWWHPITERWHTFTYDGDFNNIIPYFTATHWMLRPEDPEKTT